MPSKPNKSSGAHQTMMKMAQDVKKHAEMIAEIAEIYQKEGSPNLNVLTGNFYFALTKLREAVSSQIIKKLADPEGLDARIIANLYIRLADLADAMPKIDKK